MWIDTKGPKMKFPIRFRKYKRRIFPNHQVPFNFEAPVMKEIEIRLGWWGDKRDYRIIITYEIKCRWKGQYR